MRSRVERCRQAGVGSKGHLTVGILRCRDHHAKTSHHSHSSIVGRLLTHPGTGPAWLELPVIAKDSDPLVVPPLFESGANRLPSNQTQSHLQLGDGFCRDIQVPVVCSDDESVEKAVNCLECFVDSPFGLERVLVQTDWVDRQSRDYRSAEAHPSGVKAVRGACRLVIVI